MPCMKGRANVLRGIEKTACLSLPLYQLGFTKERQQAEGATNYMERNRPKERQITMERRIKWSDKSKRSDNLLGPRKERRITKGATNYLGAAPRGLERECRAKLPPLMSTHTCSRSHLSLTQCNQFIRTNTVDCKALIVGLSLNKKMPEYTLGLDVKDHFLNALKWTEEFLLLRRHGHLSREDGKKFFRVR